MTPSPHCLESKVRRLIDELYRQNRSRPRSFFFDALYQALPELEEMDPERVRQMLCMAFAQSEVDHASETEEVLRNLLVRVRHEANRSPDYVERIERQHAQALQRHAQANQRLDQVMRDCGERSW